MLNGAPKVDGKIANPSYILNEGQSGQLELTAAFRKNYTADLYLRASIVYYVAPNGKDINQPNFRLEPHMDIITYIPVKKGISVKAGNNTITVQASMPENVFEQYLQELYKKYGEDKVVVVKERIEPIFIAKKEYVIWEG